MKGVILSLPSKSRASRSVGSVAGFIKQNFSLLVFAFCFTIGVVCGAAAFSRADVSFLEDMDLLFATNLHSRLSQGMLSSFVAHFASDFIFFAAVALCGFSPWGVGALPFIYGFKGFGTGLSAAFLISTYGFKGFGFYLSVILPGAFLFSLCLLFMCTECSKLSLRIAKLVFGTGDERAFSAEYVRKQLVSLLRFLLLTALSALCDMLLWSFVAKLFF